MAICKKNIKNNATKKEVFACIEIPQHILEFGNEIPKMGKLVHLIGIALLF
jgi:hypothetical protein